MSRDRDIPHLVNLGEEALLSASLKAQLVKNLPATQETPVQFLGQEDPLENGIGYLLKCSWASLVARLVKNPSAMPETWARSLGWKIPWRRERLFWPGEFHGL